jgi:hypothetical protein
VRHRPVAKGGKRGPCPSAKSECSSLREGKGKETRGWKGVVPLFQYIVLLWASYGPGETEWANIGILTRETTKVKQRTFLTLKLVGKHVVFV